MHKRGMTLVEIMVVIVILTLLSSAIAVYAVKQGDHARTQVARNDMRVILDALDLYRVQRGRYPAPTASLLELRDDLNLKSVEDPWGNEYLYLLEANAPLIRTYGADGKPGGDGMNQDLATSDPEEAP